MKKPKTKRSATLTAARKEWDEIISPMIKDLRDRHGLLQDVTEELARLTGEPIKRQQVSWWFCEDAEERVVPNAGLAILLRKAFETAKGKWKGEA